MDTTWKVSAPKGGANPHFFVPEREKGYFESLAEQGFQNNLPSRAWKCAPAEGRGTFPCTSVAREPL